ncbi:MAG: hypothetical protein PHU42_02695 [Patescibacteria group bacterium]|nr:hypothetical protein [Patescibacteria group bacterium]
MTDLKYHKNLTQKAWAAMGINGMMGNIGSEISRALHWQNKGDPISCQTAIERALELTDLTLESVKSSSQIKEVARFREVLGDIYSSGGAEYNSNLEDLDKYTLQFALASRMGK